jgi:hypothetical protein
MVEDSYRAAFDQTKPQAATELKARKRPSAPPLDELLMLIATLRAQREAAPAPKPTASDGAT